MVHHTTCSRNGGQGQGVRTRCTTLPAERRKGGAVSVAWRTPQRAAARGPGERASCLAHEDGLGSPCLAHEDGLGLAHLAHEDGCEALVERAEALLLRARRRSGRSCETAVRARAEGQGRGPKGKGALPREWRAGVSPTRNPNP
jgi:hypothetical protein